MKITRKKGIDKIRITHNYKLLWIILILIIILGFLIYFILKNKDAAVDECSIDKDCIPATCCHPDSCTSIKNTPDCRGVMCTMICSGPLDCGAGNCGCVNKKCQVVSNK